ncbi:glycosyltransferase family 22 protein [Obba rivulosa]|uniref:Mannosyltransferase n=1 Tax=Obba rivulosa TaxID=1052685 RepID=A0A8E2AZX8_9APHY|nr:glycosyltransferase family 22 protein [Obba rivulosa]
MLADWQPSDRSLRLVYSGLLVLRAFFALLGKGYIHPDEHFQNGEIMAGDILGLHTFRTWEWNPSLPTRSILPLWFTTGVPYAILESLGQGRIHPKTLFLAERAVFLCLSMVLDLCVYLLVPCPRRRLLALILFASSYVTHTFQLRPFSNSTEAILVALSLTCLCTLLAGNPISSFRNGSQRSLAYLAILCVVGIFTRLTFIAFALPIVLEILSSFITPLLFRQKYNDVVRQVSLSMTAGVIVMVLSIVADTAYFRSERLSLVITPLNFLRYNLSPENLAEHGLHPRWLHAAVNLPMIIGPGLLYYAALAGLEVIRNSWTSGSPHKNVVDKINKSTSCFYIVLTSLAVLSVQPHQEPRFLVPLLVPVIVLVSNSGQIMRAGKVFWSTWVAMNLALALLFGVFHQGGVIPSLLYLHDRVIRTNVTAARPDKNFVDIFYWKTYMPPRRFLSIKEEDISDGVFYIRDNAGASSAALLESILHSPDAQTTIVVAPMHALNLLPPEIRSCSTAMKQISPHLDLDNIAESAAVGWRNGMSLGVFEVDRVCLR